METESVLQEDKLAEAVNSTQASDWRYIAEGAANLMVAYDPPESQRRESNLRNKCLRLRKRKMEAKVVVDGGDINEGDDEISFLDFHQRIISRLIDPTHLLEFHSIQLDPSWLRELNSFVEPHRPSIKRTQECIDLHAHHALLMENLTSSETDIPNVEFVAIEIKPKWSFLPQTPHLLDPITRDIKSKFCRTCVFRAVRSTDAPSKSDNDTIDEEAINNYYLSSNRFCSIQLFDEKNPNNLRHALDKLCKEWKWQEDQSHSHSQLQPRPQQKHNNFKIFRAGTTMDPLSTQLDPNFIDALTRALQESKVLRRLDYLQRRLDPIDIEGIYKSVVTMTPKEINQLLEKKIELEEYEEIIHLLGQGQGQGQGLEEKEFNNQEEFIKKFNSINLRKKLIMYALSMTFKDCSIFIKLPIVVSKFESTKNILQVAQFQPNDNDNGNNSNSSITKNWVIKLIDLDIKPLIRLPKYFQKNQFVFNKFNLFSSSSSYNNNNNNNLVAKPVTCLDICNM